LYRCTEAAVAGDDVRHFTPYRDPEVHSTAALSRDSPLDPALAPAATLHRPADADPHALVPNVADWRLTVPAGVGLSRWGCTR
jgi:hypothetical protein